jgi:hypothetical protein
MSQIRVAVLGGDAREIHIAEQLLAKGLPGSGSRPGLTRPTVRPGGLRGTSVASAGAGAPSWPCAGPIMLTKPWT